MTIQFASDIHLEFPKNKAFIMDCRLKSMADLLILAGDIVPFIHLEKHNDFFDFISDNFELTYWLPGNHEYYYSDILERSGVLEEHIRKNILLVNNNVAKHNNVKIVFTTLWSKISPANQWPIQQNISDFQVIRHEGSPLTPVYYNQLHENCVAFLNNSVITQESEKTVVVTHHVPTVINYPKQSKGSLLNEAYVTELSDNIQKISPDVWIYGHHHQNIPDFHIGNTLLTTNQLGYVHLNQQQSFNSSKIISL